MAEQTTTRVLATERGDFLVEVTGPADAPPLVFVAGLGDDHASWAAIVPSFSAEWRCVTFDNRGIGRSPITPGPYRTAEMADDAHAVVRALGLAPAAVVGSSMGGAIAEEWTLAHPEDVRALVITNSWGGRDVYLEQLFEHWIELAERGAGRDVLRSLLLFCHSPEFLAAHPEVPSAFLAAPVPDLVGFAAAARACLAHDALDRLGALALPTLIVAGTLDVLTRPALSDRLARAIPGAERVTIDAAHMIFWERPAEFSAAVSGFLGRHRPGR